MSGTQPKTLHEEARDPKTTDKRLAAMAKEHPEDLDLLSEVAQHSNTSPKTLLDIAAAVPSVAVKHPAFALLCMGGDASFAKLPTGSLIAILAHGVAPIELVRWVETTRPSWGSLAFANHSTLRAALLIGKGEQVPKLSDLQRALAVALSRSEPLPRAALGSLSPVFFAYYRHAEAGTLSHVLSAVSSSTSTSDARMMLEGLSVHPNTTVNQALTALGHLLTNRVASTRLYQDVESCASLAEQLFARPELPEDTLRYWCNPPAMTEEGRDALVRAAIRVALQRDLLSSVEREALLGREATARRALVSAASLTEAERKALAGDADYRVRAGLAARKDVPIEQLLALAADEVLYVVDAALRNPTTPDDAIRPLLSHVRRGVRRVAAEVASPAVLTDGADAILADPDGLTRLAVAIRRDAPTALLMALARDKSPTVRRAVAKNVSTPEPALLLLAKDENPRILDGLKKRPKSKKSA